MSTGRISTNEELDELLSRPSPALIALMERLEGDLLVLGVAGKMGVTLAMAARRATDAAGVSRRVIGVSRFRDSRARAQLERAGVETIACDLLDRAAVAELPRVDNVVFMAGRKFGTVGSEHRTWAANALAPANVAEHFRGSRIAAFSTGCVYPMRLPGSGGCVETDAPDPVGEYAQSCLARERVFEHLGRRDGTPVCLLRLNYAIDLRYGVLHDIARRILDDEPIDLSVGHFNCIWQGDANSFALLALRECDVPAAVLNITGPQTLSVRRVAEDLADALGRPVRFSGEDSGPVYLSDAGRAVARFGTPSVPLSKMVEWTACWLGSGGESLGKPTHFQVRDGRF